jgi:hypothetical protein
MRIKPTTTFGTTVLCGLVLSSSGCSSKAHHHDAGPAATDSPSPDESHTPNESSSPSPNEPAPSQSTSQDSTSSQSDVSDTSAPSPPPVDVEGQLNEAQQTEFASLVGQLQDAHALDADGLLAKRKLEFTELSYDPSAAEFMDTIQGSALALNDAELEKLKDNGFVISPRQGFATFVTGYASIYSEHLPVYISADAIMEALHSSYDELLKYTEQAALIPKVTSVLEAAHGALAARSNDEGALELDLYLSVARSLLSGSIVSPVAGADTAAVSEIVEMANAAEGLATVKLFGVDRDEDMSQFAPRGHYTETEELSRYFRAMMWLGRIDFRLIETQSDGSAALRRPQVNASLLLRDLFSEDGVATWTQVDSALQVFVGTSDYMVLPEVGQLLTDLGGYAAAIAADDAAVEAAIIDGGYGIQQIASHIMVNDGTTQTLPLNRSFALFGQRYVLDSHVFSQVVYDRTAEKRMMPNALDAAYAALGNDAALPLLSGELAEYGYAGNLEGARVLADAHGDEFWGGNLYNLWLSALRDLSPKAAEVADPAAAGLPEVAASEPWSRRILNAQLGSWAELRHDTLLYAKQSYTGIPSCDYPDAYVDPYPEFYARLTQYADVGLALTHDLGADLGAYEPTVSGYFQNLKSSMEVLGGMAQNQRDGVVFSEAQMAFINDAVRIEEESVVCTTVPVPDGWLADLYLVRDKSIEFDPTIADVHTQPADEVGNIVGKVLHVGTGHPRLMVTTVDTCQGPRAYAGVTFAYHEKVTDDFERLTDEVWAGQVSTAEDVEWIKPILAEPPTESSAPPMMMP